MEKYRVIGQPLILKGGIVGLTEEQAACRGYCLDPVKKKKGLYEVTGEACFKIGEIIGIEDPDSLLKVGLVESELARRHSGGDGGRKKEERGEEIEKGKEEREKES